MIGDASRAFWTPETRLVVMVHDSPRRGVGRRDVAATSLLESEAGDVDIITLGL